MEFLQSSKWRIALRNKRIVVNSDGNSEITTPMRQLITLMPKSAQYALNK